MGCSLLLVLTLLMLIAIPKTWAIDSAWAVIPPSINGNAEDRTWLSGRIIPARFGYVIVINNNDYLFMMIDAVAANTPKDIDYFRLYFDLNADGKPTPNVDVLYSVFSGQLAKLCLATLASADSLST